MRLITVDSKIRVDVSYMNVTVLKCVKVQICVALNLIFVNFIMKEEYW
jgi:hypothetical protein